jgi:hypothetical protein
MRKYLLVGVALVLWVLCCLPVQARVTVVGQPPAAAAPSEGNLAHDDFTGSTSACGETADLAWASCSTGVNLDNTTSITGMTDHKAYFNHTGWNTSYTTYSLGSNQSVIYISFDINVDALTSGENWVVRVKTSGGSEQTGVYVGYSGGLYLDIRVNGYGTVDTKTISYDTTYQVCAMFNDTANTWQWWVDSVSEGSGSADPAHVFRDITIGPEWHEAPSIYIDNFDLDSGACR